MLDLKYSGMFELASTISALPDLIPQSVFALQLGVLDIFIVWESDFLSTC